MDAWGTLSTRLYSFLTPDIVGCFASSDFTAADLYFADQPVFVFLSFHESDLLSMGPLIKFICESLIMELLNAYDDAPDTLKKKSRRILWSMDEAGRIGIPNLPEHASTVNGRNISFSMSAQDRSQFNAVYGRDRTKNLFTNIRTQLVFCQADFDTAEHYSKRMGDTSGFAHSESEHGGEMTSTGKSERAIPVMSPQDFEEMDDGELVCFMGKKKRFRVKSMDWRRHPALLKRMGMKPPANAPLPPPAERQPEQTVAQKPSPLAAWHFDPQLFRKLPQYVAAERGVGEHAQDAEPVNELSLGI